MWAKIRAEVSSSKISQLKFEMTYSCHQSVSLPCAVFCRSSPCNPPCQLLLCQAEAFGWWVRVLRCSGHRCHLFLCDQVEPTTRWSRRRSVFCSWASSLKQGDVVSKVIMLVAQAAEAAPLAHHEAEWQHEEGTDGGHDIGYGHEG